MTSDRPAILGGAATNPGGPPEWPVADPAVAEAVAAAMADGSWGRYVGPHTAALRAALAELHGVQHVHLCASGTAAVELGLRALGVGPGDEVILAAYDFEANFKDVLALGATPVLVDIRADDAQIDVGRVEEAASERTKAVLVSHLHGGVIDMPRLREIADRRDWGLLEDCCQMPGAIVHGRRAGTWGHVGTLSFGGSKLLTAGRGGAVLTDRDDLLQRIKLHTWRGNDLSPLSELQAAVLRPQLARLDADRAVRAANVARLVASLAEVDGLTPLPFAGADRSFNPTLLARHPSSLAPSPQGADAPRSPSEPDYYKFALWYDPAGFDGLASDGFAAAMRAEGVALWAGFRALHRTHARKRFRAAGDLPNAEAAEDRLLVLHHPVLLGGPEGVDRFAAAVRKVRRHAAAIRDEAPPPPRDPVLGG